MTKKLQVYETPEVTVSFDPNVCKHSGVCLRTLPAVFDVRRGQWVEPGHASANEVAAAILKCPSGALQFYRNVARDPAAASLLARRRLLNHVAVAISRSEGLAEGARAACEAITEARGYDIAAVYQVVGDEIVAVGWAGEIPPDHQRFALDQGLCGAAVQGGEVVVTRDVRTEARYLSTTTSTLSEMIVPLIDPVSREVLGTLDVASNRLDAFGTEDRETIEDCAQVILKLWAE